MTRTADLLVVAATARELAPAAGWRTLVCGVGPVEAAASTAAAIAAARPAMVLHVGIAGARRASGLVPPTLVIGTAAHYTDLAIPASWAPSVLAPDAALVTAARRALPEAVTRAIGTSARVGGTIGSTIGNTAGRTTHDVEVEAMEGFAVLRAAQLAGVPALEVRAISNAIEETDRARWAFDAAFAAIVAATPRLVAELGR